eukprot:Blabericola_migrator_1__6301@NODE_317_length_9889_cov_67_793016_g258_i0_p4_GENE_NODE_317_length_9889_cov_67_793016_g258_i0NODE_317_length_9889_cov_67_793016_g258_i0_p4_ORF_typecomplete_len502_score61_37_NODE_317_length_9889_cov_67_793016_g258_i059847489
MSARHLPVNRHVINSKSIATYLLVTTTAVNPQYISDSPIAFSSQDKNTPEFGANAHLYKRRQTAKHNLMAHDFTRTQSLTDMRTPRRLKKHQGVEARSLHLLGGPTARPRPARQAHMKSSDTIDAAKLAASTSALSQLAKKDDKRFGASRKMSETILTKLIELDNSSRRKQDVQPLSVNSSSAHSPERQVNNESQSPHSRSLREISDTGLAAQQDDSSSIPSILAPQNCTSAVDVDVIHQILSAKKADQHDHDILQFVNKLPPEHFAAQLYTHLRSLILSYRRPSDRRFHFWRKSPRLPQMLDCDSWMVMKHIEMLKGWFAHTHNSLSKWVCYCIDAHFTYTTWNGFMNKREVVDPSLGFENLIEASDFYEVHLRHLSPEFFTKVKALENQLPTQHRELWRKYKQKKSLNEARGFEEAKAVRLYRYVRCITWMIRHTPPLWFLERFKAFADVVEIVYGKNCFLVNAIGEMKMSERDVHKFQKFVRDWGTKNWYLTYSGSRV